MPGFAVGDAAVAPAGDAYELYYLFPLTSEQDTLDSSSARSGRRGLALLLLSAAIACDGHPAGRAPGADGGAHRGAARRRSAAGTHRGPGEDDLARLGASFNHMADILQRQISQLEDLSACSSASSPTSRTSCAPR